MITFLSAQSLLKAYLIPFNSSYDFAHFRLHLSFILNITNLSLTLLGKKGFEISPHSSYGMNGGFRREGVVKGGTH